jgi:hypothetical protein
MTTNTEYPAIADLMGGMFHQDFDLVGNTVAEIMAAFREVTPCDEQVGLKAEIARFLEEHGNDLDEAFEKTLRPDLIPSAFSGSTRAFLEEIRGLLA